MELKKPSTLLSPSTLNANNNSSNANSNQNNGASTSNQKVPLGAGPSLMMGAAHGNLAGPLGSSPGDAKLSTTAAVSGFTSAPADEKGGFANG